MRRWPDWIDVRADMEIASAPASERSADAASGPVAQRPRPGSTLATRRVTLLVAGRAAYRRARAWLGANRTFLWPDADGTWRRARVRGGGDALEWRLAAPSATAERWEAQAEITGWL